MTRKHFPILPSLSVLALIKHNRKSIDVRHLCSLWSGGGGGGHLCVSPYHLLCASCVNMDLMELEDMNSGCGDENYSLASGFPESCSIQDWEEPVFGLIELGG